MTEYPDSIHAKSAGYLRFAALRDLGEHNSAVAAAEAILTQEGCTALLLLCYK
jgi:hypothetical protein